MRYRRPKLSPHDQRDWMAWRDARLKELVALGLPPEFYLEQSHWEDFLENGFLDWHFSVTKISVLDDFKPEQQCALADFLEAEYGQMACVPTLLGFLRVRREKWRTERTT